MASSKIGESSLTWFCCMTRSSIEVLVRRLDQIEGSQINRGRGRLRKVLDQTIKKDLI